MKLKAYFLETRPHFLLLSVVLAFLGSCIASYHNAFHLRYALLAAVGLVLTHISVNVLNDYFDHRSGIDAETRRTPFSGGSGIIQEGLLTPREVFLFGLISFLLALPIGVYFVMVWGGLLLPLLIVASACVLLYTPIILKFSWPEWSPGVGLGALPVMGVYFVQAGTYTLPSIIAAVPSGILVHNLLLLNEFPDVDADRKGGRKTLPITVGIRKAGVIYSVLTMAVYLWILGGVLAGQLPPFSLIALCTLPFAIMAIAVTLKTEDVDKLLPAQQNNVLVVLLTQLLFGIGFLIAAGG